MSIPLSSELFSESSRDELLFLYRHMHFLHFRDDDRVRPVALKHDPVHSHMLAHQLVPLTVIRHLVRDKQIQVAILLPSIAFHNSEAPVAN